MKPILPYHPVPPAAARTPLAQRIDRVLVSGIGSVLAMFGSAIVIWWFVGSRGPHGFAPDSPLLGVGLLSVGVFALWIGLRK